MADTSGNRTAAFDPNDTVFTPDPRYVRITIYFFLSIILSLSAALVGLVCKQWIRQYQRDASLDPLNAIKLRRLRYRGLIQWHVPAILQALPEILQLGVILFFVGVLEFTFSLDSKLAAVVTAVVGLVLFVLFAFTIAPVFYYHRNIGPDSIMPCPYKSTLSRILLRLTMVARTWMHQLEEAIRDYLRYEMEWRLSGKLVTTDCRVTKSLFSNNKSWLDFDRRALERTESYIWNKSHIYKSIQEAKKFLGFNPTVVSHLFHCVVDPATDVPNTFLDPIVPCDIHPNNNEERLPRSIVVWYMLRGLGMDARLRAEVGCNARMELCLQCHSFMTKDQRREIDRDISLHSRKAALNPTISDEFRLKLNKTAISFFATDTSFHYPSARHWWDVALENACFSQASSVTDSSQEVLRSLRQWLSRRVDSYSNGWTAPFLLLDQFFWCDTLQAEVRRSQSDRPDPPVVTRMIDDAVLHFSIQLETALSKPDDWDDDGREKLNRIQNRMAERIQQAKHRLCQSRLIEGSVGQPSTEHNTQDTHQHVSDIQAEGSSSDQPMAASDDVGNAEVQISHQLPLAGDIVGITSALQDEKDGLGPDTAEMGSGPLSQSGTQVTLESSVMQLESSGNDGGSRERSSRIEMSPFEAAPRAERGEIPSAK